MVIYIIEYAYPGILIYLLTGMAAYAMYIYRTYEEVYILEQVDCLSTETSTGIHRHSTVYKDFIKHFTSEYKRTLYCSCL